MSRVFVTGVNSFTGRYLAPRLAADGHEVHGLVHEGADSDLPGVARIHAGALDDLQLLAEILAEVQPNKVVHLAAISFVGHGNVDEIYRTNLLGTRNLLKALADTAAKPSVVLLASSANIYGNKHEGAIGEDAEPDPVNDYAVSKLAMEYVARLFSDQLPITVVRPFNYTGVGQSASFVIPKIVEHARKKLPSISLGNLDVFRDFSDVRTVADAYARLLTHDDAAGETFNVCSGRAYSLREIIDLVKKISGHDFDVVVDMAHVRTNEVRSLFGRRDKLDALIGNPDMPPLEDTLRWMLEA